MPPREGRCSPLTPCQGLRRPDWLVRGREALLSCAPQGCADTPIVSSISRVSAGQRDNAVGRVVDCNGVIMSALSGHIRANYSCVRAGHNGAIQDCSYRGIMVQFRQGTYRCIHGVSGQGTSWVIRGNSCTPWGYVHCHPCCARIATACTTMVSADDGENEQVRGRITPNERYVRPGDG